MSTRAYEHNQTIAADPRTTEQRMLAKVTGMLIAAKEPRARALVAACYYNRKLWTIFQADLADPGNALPDKLKAELISLSLFVQRYTSDVLNGAAVDPLIEVNRSIMAGLATPASLPP